MARHDAKKIVPDLFATAKPIEAKPIDPFKVKSRKQHDEVSLGTTLDTLAAIRALSDSLQSIYITCEKEIKEKMADEFVDRAITIGKRPENFRGISTSAEASCELRRRSSASFLSDDEKNLLDTHNIPIDTKVVAEAIPDRYFFNPDLVTDASLASKINAALASIPELQGHDVLLHQVAREESVRFIVAEDALDAIAKLKERDIVGQLMKIASTLALKPKLIDADLDKVIGIIRSVGVKL